MTKLEVLHIAAMVSGYVVWVGALLLLLGESLAWLARRPRRRNLMKLPTHTRTVYDTECTCDQRVAAKIQIDGRWRPVCARCGSLR